jgi:HK97 family phage prohead protease
MKRDFSLFTGLLKTARHGDDLILTGVASSTIKDRHGDTMTPNALESMLRTADGMTIYLNHSYNVPEDVAGTVRSAWIDKSSDELHDLHFEIAMETGNPRAVQAFNAIDKGTKLGLSIGAMIPEGGAKRTKAGSYVINDVELLETSIVSIPANPRSWVEYARKSLMTKADIPEEDDEPMEKELTAEDFEHKSDPSEAEPTLEEIGGALEGTGEGTPLPPVEDLGDAVQVLAAVDGTRIEYFPTTTTGDHLDFSKAKVTVWPSGKVSVDTTPSTPSQDATPQAEPETEESTDALSQALGEMSRDITPEVKSLLGPTVMASLQSSQQLTLALVVAVEKATERATKAESERDEVIRAAKVLTETTEAFIARVSATPRGRRAISREVPATAKALDGIRESGLYSDEFMDILQKGATQHG